MSHVVQDDHNATCGEHKIFDDKFPGECKHGKMRVERKLWRRKEHRKGANKVQYQDSVRRLWKYVENEREADECLKTS